LKKATNIGSREELLDPEYILINDSKLKLPFQKGNADTAIAFKFIQNPIQIGSEDDLFDLVEMNKGLPVKYFCTFVNKKASTSSAQAEDLTLQNKLLRKLFYENSSFMEDISEFVEISDAQCAERLGGLKSDEIVVI
jgi:hypothetical protein